MDKKSSVLVLILILIFLPILAYAQPLESQIQISVSAQVEEESTPPSVPPTGGGGGAAPPSAKVVFEGRAYPNAFLTILKNGQAAATFFALPSGLFKKELTGVSGGIYTFGIWAQDTEGRKSVTLSFTVSILQEKTTTISGIFISPTIDVGPSQVERGNIVNILGQVFPESNVNIFIASNEIVKTTKASLKGDWIYKLDSSSLEEREHQARAKAVYGDGEQSPFSQTLSFLVVKRGALVCRGADLNFDKKINLIDFSILLYYWHQKKPTNICADINQDGIVDLVDFSIMMYYWTK